MPRVVLVGNLAQITGGVAEFQLSATSVKQLFELRQHLMSPYFTQRVNGIRA